MKMKDRKTSGYEEVRNGFKNMTLLILFLLLLVLLSSCSL